MLHQWIFNMITDVLNVNQMNVDWQLSHLSLEVVGKVQKRNKEGENRSLITLEWEWKIDPYLPDRKREKEKTKDLLLHQRPLPTCERERNSKREIQRVEESSIPTCTPVARTLRLWCRPVEVCWWSILVPSPPPHCVVPPSLQQAEVWQCHASNCTQCFREGKHNLHYPASARKPWNLIGWDKYYMQRYHASLLT